MSTENTAQRLLRLPQIIGRPATKNKPGITPIIPISRTAWYDGIAKGIYPAPEKLSPRTSVWRESDVMAVVAGTYQPEGGAR